MHFEGENLAKIDSSHSNVGRHFLEHYIYSRYVRQFEILNLKMSFIINLRLDIYSQVLNDSKISAESQKFCLRTLRQASPDIKNTMGSLRPKFCVHCIDIKVSS